MPNRREFLIGLWIWLWFPCVEIVPKAKGGLKLAGWVRQEAGVVFLNSIDPEAPHLEGKAMYLVASETEFSPGWLAEFQQQTAGLFRPEYIFLPVVLR